MARTARLAYINLLTTAGVVITSSADAVGFPVTNLASPARWKKWRSTSTVGDQWVKFDLGALKAMQALIAIDYKVHTGGTLRIQAHATDVWSAPTVDQLIVLPNPNPTKVAATWLSAVENLRWVRFYFTNTGAVNTYVELGVGFVGTYFEPAVSLAPRYGLQRVDPSPISRVPGGQRTAERRTPYFTLNGAFNAEPDTDRPSFITVYDTVGIHSPFIFAINPDDPAYFVFYGRFEETLNINHITMYRWGIPFRFSEDL